jgi:U3 small nucleolar RNA-associated protein 12
MKIYKKYQPKETLGIISSGLVVSVGEDCVSNALTNLVKWNLKQGTSTIIVEGEKLVTALAKHKEQLAIGYNQFNNRYADGSIKLVGNQVVFLNGHRSAVTSLCFDKNGTRLASGSSDTDIVLWDIVSEEGIFRFKGHKDQVTCISFLEENVNHLISGSKDSVIKVWDIDAKCVVENIVLHRGEVWALAVYGSVLLTGASDGQLRVWNIDYSVLNQKFASIGEESETTEIKKAITLLGVITRQNNERINSIKFHENGIYIGVQGTERVLEVFKIKTEAEISKAIKRRNKRALKSGAEVSTEITLGDKIGQFNIIRTRAKVKSFDFVTEVKNDHLRVIMGLGNNSIETFDLDLEDSKAAPRQVSCIELQGHRSDVRSVALNEDDQYIASSSNECLKIYSTVSGNCLQTMETGYALCSAFLPGSKHVVVGTKTGDCSP